MSNPTETLPLTDIAAVCWAGSGDKTCVRVYTQDLNGGIRESAYDGTSWTFNKDPIAQAKPRSAIAAFKHYEDIHVYYISSDNVIQEVCRDWRKSLVGNWDVGSLSACNIKAHPLSRLAALAYTKDIDCTVFYQNPDGYIGHLRRVDSGGVTWKVQDPLGNKVLYYNTLEHLSEANRQAIYGTGLAAVSPDPYGSAQIRVYFQQSDTSLTDFGVDNNSSYQPGILNQANPPPKSSTNTSLSAVLNELYFLNSSNWISEGGYYGSTWHFENHPDHTIARPGSGIAATLDSSGLHRVYVQDDMDQIVEHHFTKPWENHGATVVPTGNLQ